MRPNLSPFEYGAYGTPSTKASVVVGGPHISSDGKAVTIEESDRDMATVIRIVVKTDCRGELLFRQARCLSKFDG